jgi:hypothetical protein
MSKKQIALTTEESTFLTNYFLKVRKFVSIGDKEEQEIEKRIYKKIEDSGYLDGEDDGDEK